MLEKYFKKNKYLLYNTRSRNKQHILLYVYYAFTINNKMHDKCMKKKILYYVMRI